MVETQAFARHADARMTMKHSHIGLKDHAKGTTPTPRRAAQLDACSTVEWLGVQRRSGAAGGSPVSEPEPHLKSINEQSPAEAGLASSSVVNCHQKAVYSEVEAAGIAPALNSTQVFTLCVIA